MFTGIIEELAQVYSLRSERSNLHITFKSLITPELKIDQSISHNGVCLTVIDINKEFYTVTAIKETLDKSNLSALQVDSKVNIERCMLLSDRIDGHLVQGHVDQTAECVGILNENGSYIFTFRHNDIDSNTTVEKGSVCVNGVSLTVINSKNNSFAVAIIPYTYEHTNFKYLKVGNLVNIEFDIIGKYISKMFPKNSN